MGKYGTTESFVFGNNDSVDKPSLKYMETIEGKEEPLNVDMTNIRTVEFYTQHRNIRMLKMVNDETNETLYYRFKRVLKFVKNNYLVQFELDYGCTYTSQLLDADFKVLSLRNHSMIVPTAFQFNDNLIDANKIKYENYEFYKNYVKQNGLTFQGTTHDITYKNNDDIINACYVVVLNDDTVKNNNFTFLPLLSLSNSVTIDLKTEPNLVVSDNHFDKQINEPFKTIGRLEDNRGTSIKKEYNEKTNQGGDCKVKIGSGFFSYRYYEKDITEIFQKYNLDNIGIEGIHKGFISTEYRFRVYHDNTLLVDDKVDGVGGFGSPSFNIELTYNKNGIPQKRVEVHNSYNDLYLLSQGVVGNEKGINKIQGVYIFPNVFNFEKRFRIRNIEGKDRLVYDIPTNGCNLDNELKISLLQVLNLEPQFNKDTPTFPQVLNYYDLKWFNNNIRVTSSLNNNFQIDFKMGVNFTSNLIGVLNNDRQNITNNIINFPSQQPFSIDTYRQYVAANMNTTNTGYAIQKQNAIFSGISGVANSISSGVIGAALGNPAGAITGAVMGGANAIASNVVKVSQYERQVKAKYADANNTMGNQLLFGPTEDIIFTNELNKEKKQYDLFYYKKLSEDSIKYLNNHFMMNGCYNPINLKGSSYGVDDFLGLGFRYMKIDMTDVYTIVAEGLDIDDETKDIVLSQMEEIRLGDRVPSFDKYYPVNFNENEKEDK